MHRFLPGLILVQAVTALLLWLSLDSLDTLGWLRVAAPALLLSVVTAFWFSAIAKHGTERELARTKERHAREQADLQVKTERAKTRIIRETQKQITREVSRAHSKANLKVGLAFAGMAGVGTLLMFTQFMTLGLLTLSAAGGALGGYVLRARKDLGRRRQEGGGAIHVPSRRITHDATELPNRSSE